jgi:selenocysteine lyase/cysteine desulfurase
MIKAREVAANRVNAPLNNIFLVQNSTDAINCLLKSLKWKAGDTIAIANTAYACVRKTV